VRFRIDGELHRIMNIPLAMAQPVVSRVKVLANMDVTERRRPQDGHFELKVESHNFDFRISTLPAIMGEKMVIRILDTAQVMTGLHELGLLAQQEKMVEWMLDRPHGMILVTGPTGSGKTSTLYTGLQRLNSEQRNLVTIEDPVEYQLPGINQVQVDANIGMTFSEGLRSILRQDPDVIMVGEIRDGDTARIAIRAAMTGHLVLSTLHTNTALGAVDALVHLGAVPFMVAGSLVGIVSQRLLRRLCPQCKKSARMTPKLAVQIGLPEKTSKKIFRAAGCEECFHSGYMGRTGVFEVIRLNEKLKTMISDPAKHSEELERAAREEGMLSIEEAAAQKVLEGATSVEEVSRKIVLDV
jgi:type IV pilus assembly protein PilB